MPDKTRTLGQVAGVMMHIRQKDGDAGKDLQKRVQSEALTTGMTKVYKPDDENAPSTAREPDRHKAVAVKVEEVLREAALCGIPALDITATADRTNQVANADIIVEGKILVPAVPVSHLLWLGGYLGEWKKFVSLLPVLDPTKNWTPDEGRGIHKGDEEETVRFTKEVVSLLGIAPTDKHPGQWQPIQKETRVGKYVSIVLSGAVTEARKKHLIAQADILITAVKDAAARANLTPATEETSEGTAIFGFLLA
jgi:hypothetical protein